MTTIKTRVVRVYATYKYPSSKESVTITLDGDHKLSKEILCWIEQFVEENDALEVV